MNDEQIILLIEEIHTRLNDIKKQQAPNYQGVVQDQTEEVARMAKSVELLTITIKPLTQLNVVKFSTLLNQSYRIASRGLYKDVIKMTNSLQYAANDLKKAAHIPFKYYIISLLIGLIIGTSVFYFSIYSGVRNKSTCEFFGGELTRDYGPRKCNFKID